MSFGKKKDKPMAGVKVDGSDQSIFKVQEMGTTVAYLRSELGKVSTELSARMAQVDALQQGLDMANGRVAILEGVIANTYSSVMVPQTNSANTTEPIADNW